MKINSTTPQEQLFLQRITSVAKPPKTLYFTGVLPTHTEAPVIAIVGTRKPTAYGKEVAYTFAYELAQKGAVIVSGLALGIDGIAHRAALDAGGTTVAVLANGLDKIYPSTHAQLGARIIENKGAIISEYEAGIAPYPSQFLSRNRIISGLSQAILIVEAAARSGTLNTAMHALEQGREVFVIPGNITSPLSAGCNALIKQGAHPAITPQDILDVIAPQSITTKPQQLTLGDTPEEQAILRLLQSGIRDGEELQQKSKLQISIFNQTMTMLEIKGFIRALGANNWAAK